KTAAICPSDGGPPVANASAAGSPRLTLRPTRPIREPLHGCNFPPTLRSARRHAVAASMSSVSEIDWATWCPTDRATLLFIIERDRILLIEKKRGLGAGKVNAPGGRIEPGERAIDCAIRELREELCVGAQGVVERGELSFHFLDGYKLHCRVFRGDICEGEPI